MPDAKTRPIPLLLTVKEAAEILRCHPITVYRRATRGDLPVVRIGRGRGRVMLHGPMLIRMITPVEVR